MSIALLALITLAMGMAVILSAFDDALATAFGAVDTVFPAKKAHCFVALPIVNQIA